MLPADQSAREGGEQAGKINNQGMGLWPGQCRSVSPTGPSLEIKVGDCRSQPTQRKIFHLQPLLQVTSSPPRLPTFSFLFLRIEFQKVCPRGRKSIYLKRLTDTYWGTCRVVCPAQIWAHNYFPVPFISQVRRHLCLNPEPPSVNNSYWVPGMGQNSLPKITPALCTPGCCTLIILLIKIKPSPPSAAHASDPASPSPEPTEISFNS